MREKYKENTIKEHRYLQIKALINHVAFRSDLDLRECRVDKKTFRKIYTCILKCEEIRVL